jgi:signal peptidase I
LQLLNKIVKLLFFAFLIWIATRVFIFRIFQVPTASMHQTLLEGDYIFVNKLAYGARLPITPLCFPGNGKIYLDWLHLPYVRIPGFTKVKLNDVIVFNYPIEDDFPVDMRKEYIKRCIALPGDSLTIVSGVHFVNGKKQDNPETILYSYRAHSIEKDTNLFVTQKNADSFLKTKNFLSIAKNILPPSSYNPSLFPNSSVFKWNLDYFGPFYIPKKGATIPLNAKTLLLYKHVIEKYEGNTLIQKQDSILINGKAIQTPKHY